jgi:dihydroorotase
MKYLIRHGKIINEGKIEEKDILIDGTRIARIDHDISDAAAAIIDAAGKYVMPGIIDDQVHFREPGLTHKATIYTEARAAVAGGVTSFMEMPNTKPAALTQQLLEEKYQTAAKSSLANYSFFMGASNDNLEEVLRTDAENVCGVKIFMGSSTGNMLVDKDSVLRMIFSQSPMLIATHCEDERTIQYNSGQYRQKYGENVPMSMHPEIRNDEACYLSSSFAVALAQEYHARLHILHISTKKELELFRSLSPPGERAVLEKLASKKITNEVCVHHLYFQSDDYARLGSNIKCNPAIKYKPDKEALFEALLDDTLDIIATDHAPHTKEEKQLPYFEAPSGLPLVQHSLNVMLYFYHEGKIRLEKIIEKMCHAPAVCFNIRDRGFLREGYFADIAVVDPDVEWKVDASNIFYKCGWSPFEEQPFKGKVTHTFVSGHPVWKNGSFDESVQGMRLSFNTK